jgi:hypothetical protein
MEGGPHDGYHIQTIFNKTCKMIAIHLVTYNVMSYI